MANIFSKFLSAAGNLQKADPAAFQTLVDEASLLEAAKGMPGSPGANDGAAFVTDLYQGREMHTTPSREQINVGEPTGATGAAQPAMNTRYSDNAPQKGIEMVAERLGEMTGNLRGYGKALTSMATLMAEQMKSHNALIEVLTKAAEDDEEDEEFEASEKSATKAKAWLAKARERLLAAAEKAEEADDMEPGEERKACKTAAKALRKTAAKALIKSRLYASAARKAGADVRKSITEIVAGSTVLKADMEAVQEDEDDEDEESSKARFDLAVEKAVGEKVEALKAAMATGGNQATGQDPNGNQPAKTAKADIDPSLKGQIEVLSMTVNQLMQRVQGQDALPAPGQQTSAPGSFALLKGEPKALTDKLQDAIDTALDSNLLTDADQNMLTSLTSMVPAVMKGNASESIFKARLEAASPTVKSIFNQALGAAA